MYQEKIEGEICQQCHKAKYVKNPRTGKIFCEDKCWLSSDAKNEPVSNQNIETVHTHQQNNKNVPEGQFLPITQYLETLDMQRKAFKQMQDIIDTQENKIKELTNRLGGIETILENDLKISKESIDLHQSFNEEGIKPHESLLGDDYKNIPLI